jgi:site-specific DNA recombinase
MSNLTVFHQFGKGEKIQNTRTSNCVIYTRVSTKEQADNNMSLETQRKSCEQFAGKNSYAIMGFFGGTYESAKTDERKEFNNMLSFVKKSREKIAYIIVYSVDRFSRSGANAIYIAEQLRKQGIAILSVTQPTDSSTPNGSLQQNIQFIFSEYDNQLRREKCMNGVREALLRGEWCQSAPIGYEKKKVNGKRIWVVSEKGELLRKAFLWKATEKISNEEAKERLAKLGLQLSHQQISSMFRNPFYCGLIAHNSLEGQVVEGIHEKLISREIFLKVNDIQNHNPHGYTTTEENNAIPLKRFIRCEYCSRFLRGYIVKAKGLYYYKCNHKGCNCNRSAKDLHAMFLSKLSEYSLYDESLVPLIRKQTLATYYKLSENKHDEKSSLKERLLELDRKTARQKDRVEKEEIPYALFLEFEASYEKEKKEIQKELDKASKGVSNPEECVDLAIQYALNLPSLWRLAEYREKQRLQFMVFPEGIFYNRKSDECRTEKVTGVFAYMADLERGLRECKSRNVDDLSNVAALVENTGVEPVTSCMPCKRSSQLS